MWEANDLARLRACIDSSELSLLADTISTQITYLARIKQSEHDQETSPSHMTGARREKTCLRGLRLDKAQNDLLDYLDYLEL